MKEGVQAGAAGGLSGFKLADFSRPQDVMAINWRGLPMPLDELVRHQKKVIHPVKDVDRPEHEREVRSFFKQLRLPAPL